MHLSSKQAILYPPNIRSHQNFQDLRKLLQLPTRKCYTTYLCSDTHVYVHHTCTYNIYIYALPINHCSQDNFRQALLLYIANWIAVKFTIYVVMSLNELNLFTFLAVNSFSTGTNSLSKCACVSVVKLASSKLNSRQTSIVNNTHPLV